MSKHINRNWKYFTSLNIKVGDLIHYKGNAYGDGKYNLCIVTEVNLDPTPREKIMVDNNLGSYNKEFITDFCKQRDNGKYSYIKFHDASQGSTSVLLLHSYYKSNYSVDSLSSRLMTPTEQASRQAYAQLVDEGREYGKQLKADWMSKYPKEKGESKNKYHHHYIYDDYRTLCNTYLEEQEKASGICIEKGLQQWVKDGCDMREQRKTIINSIPFAADVDDGRLTSRMYKNTCEIEIRYSVDKTKFDIPYWIEAGIIDWDVDERDTTVANMIASIPDRLKDNTLCRPEDFWGTSAWFNQQVVEDIYQINKWWGHTFTLEN